MSLTSDLQAALTTLMGTTQTSVAAAATAWANALGAITSWGSAAIPIKLVCPAYLSAGDVSANFDGTGLGITARWLGWAICNGNNGTPNLNNVFPRWSTAAAGTTGGADSQASNVTGAVLSGAPGIGTLAAPAHTHGLSAGFADIGAGLGNNRIDWNPVAGEWTNAYKSTALTWTPDTTAESYGTQLAGHTDSASATALTGAPAIGTLAVSALVNNAVENRPAFSSIVPVMRIT